MMKYSNLIAIGIDDRNLTIILRSFEKQRNMVQNPFEDFIIEDFCKRITKV